MKSVFPLVGIAAITIATVTGHAPDPVRGRDLFVSNCATCHGNWAQGDGPAAAVMGINAPDLTRIATRRAGEFPYHDVRQIIEGRRDVAEHGPRIMPEWGKEFAMTAGGGGRGEDEAWEKIEALVAYLESIQEETPRD